MSNLTKLFLFLFAVAATVMVVCHGESALHATVPKDMPGDSHFVQSGFDLQHNEAKGEWIACRADTAEDSDWCRVTDAHGTVVYQGAFSPIQSENAIPNNQLQVSSNSGAYRWITGPAESGPVPVIPLRNGQVLVPRQDREALRDRWNQNPEEYRQIQGM